MKYQSYAHQALSQQQIIKLAKQYAAANMAKLLGADEDNFPFIVRVDGKETVVFWSKYSGMNVYPQEDPVMSFAAIEYLKSHAYPQFASMKAARQYAIDHDWPRKSR